MRKSRAKPPKLPVRLFETQLKLPLGFQLAGPALLEFLRSWADGPLDLATRKRQVELAEQLIVEGLSSGSLMIFFLKQDATVQEAPIQLWSSRANRLSLLESGGGPLQSFAVNGHDSSVELVAMFDKYNFSGFLRWAGRWPTFPITAELRLALYVCEVKDSLIAEGHPVRKKEVIHWLRYNWPKHISERWSSLDRLTKKYNNPDNCPPFVSELVNVALEQHEKKPGIITVEEKKFSDERCKRHKIGLDRSLYGTLGDDDENDDEIYGE